MTHPNTGGLSARFRQRSESTRLFHTVSKLVATFGLAAVAASAAVTVPGYLTYEYYPGKTRDDIESGNAGTPSTSGSVVGSDKSGVIPTFESGTNFADNYSNRVYGYFVPPTTGDYVFFLACDDDGDLFLSTDATAANKKLIAQESGWSAVRSYNSVGGGSTVGDKRSDQCTVSAWPTATGTGAKITLTANQKYYIEAVHHEGGGGDNLAVTYKLASGPDPKNGDAPTLTGKVIATDVASAPPAPHIAITAQPVGGAFYTVAPMALVVGYTSDSPYPVQFQWRKDGTAIPNATSQAYSVGAPTAADAGKYDVQISAPGPDGNPVTVTSSAATVTISTPTVATVTGQVKYEYFPGFARTDVEAGTAIPGGTGPAGNDGNGYISIAESGTNFADNYANRISGYFIPPATADYVFYIAGDDDSDLFLSTDSSPANKKLIAQESGWSGVRVYNGVGGGSKVEDKRSDQSTITQWPGGNTIHLTKGSKYYFEGIHHEGGGGDNLAITYRLATDDESLTADGTAPRLTGDVVAVDIPKIISVGAVNSANPKAFSFSISDSAPSVVDNANVTLLVDGASVPVVAGTKDSTGSTPFTATYATPFAQGSSHVYTIQAKDTSGQSITKSAAFGIGVQWWPTADLKAPAVVDKKWASRFIFGVKDAAGNTVGIGGGTGGLQQTFKILVAQGSPDFLTGANNSPYSGSYADVTTDVVNWNGGGHFGNDNPYPDAATTDANWTGHQFINLNIGNLVIGEEGDYTFGIHSDDGMALRIRGGQAVSISGNGQLDPVDSEAMVHPADTGDSSTRVVYHLRKGVYRIEFFWWENGGGNNGEIYAAKGAFKNDGDTSAWRLIGDPTPSQSITLLGVDNNGWSIASSDPNGADQITSWDLANAAFAATGGGAKNYDTLNVGDPDTNAGVAAFPKDVAGKDDNDYVLKATGTLVVPQDGTYILGFNSDDGGYMKVPGGTFTAIQQNNTGNSVINGDTVICDCLTGDSGTTATITLKKGNQAIEFGSFERGGGSFLAGHGALLPANPISTGDLPFLSKGASGTVIQTASALQLTSAPADGGGPVTPSQPTAKIAVSGTSVTISSTSGTPTVQKTDKLGTGATWSDVGPAPQTVQTTGKGLFFRLKQ